MEDHKEGIKDEGEENFINLKVVNQAGNEVHFKIKRSMPMRKLIKTFCKRERMNETELKFQIDGEEILPDKTPDDLDLEEGDVIEVFSTQVGGYLLL